MKKNSELLFSQISQDQIRSITTVVKETLAANVTKPIQKVFSAAELWDIQRRRRTFSYRKFAF